jgi:hypothetical protein
VKKTALFITYNPNLSEEETLAIRLHTIGTANGFQMYLPDRYHSQKSLDMETKNRIDNADYFILFSLSPNLSAEVQEELNYAWKRFNDKRKIIVIFHSKKTKSLILNGVPAFTEFAFDPAKQHMDQIMGKIMGEIFQKETKKKQSKEVENGLLALLGIGLGLFILNEVTKNGRNY